MRDAALFIASRSASAEAGLLTAIRRGIRNIVRSWRSRSEVARLADFDDHMLADIGLTRDDVHAALDAPFASDPGLELEHRVRRNARRGWNA